MATPDPLDHAQEIVEIAAIHAAIDDEVLTRTLVDEVEGLWTIEVEAEDNEPCVFLSIDMMGEEGEDDQSVCIGLSHGAVANLVALLFEAQAFAGRSPS